jgi:hypothetical protein
MSSVNAATRSGVPGRNPWPAHLPCALCRHFKVACQHDPLIASPEPAIAALEHAMRSVECHNIWMNGSLHEALAFETHAGEHMSSELAKAVAITMPLTSFFRITVMTAAHWVWSKWMRNMLHLAQLCTCGCNMSPVSAQRCNHSAHKRNSHPYVNIDMHCRWSKLEPSYLNQQRHGSCCVIVRVHVGLARLTRRDTILALHHMLRT